jgi:hypothetical protein
MAGRWHAFVPTTPGKRDEPQVKQLEGRHEWCHPTRRAALAALKRQVSQELKAAQERAAELGRALAAIREMES